MNKESNEISLYEPGTSSQLTRHGEARENGANGQSLPGIPGQILWRIPVKTGATIRFLHVQDIESFESSGNYLKVWHARGSSLIRETISQMATELPPRWFARISRTTIINLKRVQEVTVESKRKRWVVLSGGRRYPLTRPLSEFQELIKYI